MKENDIIITETTGVIEKGIGGFYYVRTSGGVLECKAKGTFRKLKITPLVGDFVSVKPQETGYALIEDILPRKNRFERPPVANVTQMAAVIAAANPRPNLAIFDRLLTEGERAGVKILVCVNKNDIESGQPLAQIYQSAGFDTIVLSAEHGEGIDLLLDKLRDNVTVFSGNSGVGKSSLLNLALGHRMFETGEVSERAERGKHTTRHSELVELKNGGFVIDTPGFGSFGLQPIPANELAPLFREFGEYIGQCRFLDCSHTVEKGCAVLEALENGKISESRHKSYCAMYDELKKLKQWEL